MRNKFLIYIFCVYFTNKYLNLEKVFVFQIFKCHVHRQFPRTSIKHGNVKYAIEVVRNICGDDNNHFSIERIVIMTIELNNLKYSTYL